ncbi:MAG: aldehyde dehydrogenase family protein, partial [Myxococcota bacterium]
ETAGCNSVVLESAHDLDRALHAIAHSVCIFSSQMCTAAQNIFVPRSGVATDDGHVAYDDVVARLAGQLDRLTDDPKVASALCGAIMSERTLEEMDALQTTGEKVGRIARAPGEFENAEFPAARTRSPLLVELDSTERDVYGREHFGPMAFVIRSDSPAHALERATEDAKAHGAIASYGYSIDPEFQDTMIDAYASAGASVGINLLRQLPINYAAAYSDFHVTGLNPAGTACLSDLAFVASRFRITQSKTERSV